MSKVLPAVLMIGLLSGCVADGGIVGRSQLVEGYKYLADTDETIEESCCDDEYRILTPVEAWYRPDGQRETVEVRWIWAKNRPKRFALQLRLVTADGFRQLKRAEIEVDGKMTRLRQDRKLTDWEGNDMFRGPCLPPACLPDAFLFRSARIFRGDVDVALASSHSDRVRVIVYDESNKPIYGYLPPRSDISRQRRHLTFWAKHLDRYLTREPDFSEEYKQ